MNGYPGADIQVLAPGVVLLSGLAAVEAMYLVDASVKVAASRGSRHLGRFRDLSRALHRAYDMAQLSPRRHDDTTFDDVQPDSETYGDGYRISTADAAELLGVTVRTIQRLAPELGGFSIGRAWTFDRETVLVHKALRDQRNGERNGR